VRATCNLYPCTLYLISHSSSDREVRGLNARQKFLEPKPRAKKGRHGTTGWTLFAPVLPSVQSFAALSHASSRAIPGWGILANSSPLTSDETGRMFLLERHGTRQIMDALNSIALRAVRADARGGRAQRPGSGRGHREKESERERDFKESYGRFHLQSSP